jgi:hypothetical protein
VVVQHDERAAARSSEPPAREARVDELDAPVGARGQRIEDLAVEDEGAVHPRRRAQRVVEAGVVGDAKIAPEPEQRGAVGAGKGGTSGGHLSQTSRRIKIRDRWPMQTINLTSHFLIAMPAMQDPNFSPHAHVRLHTTSAAPWASW